jgi:DNA-binding NtrC family response regulator
MERESASRLLLDRAELHVVAGPDQGRFIPIGLSSITIGSSSACDLVLHDGAVSSRHARIVVDSRGYVLKDLGSKNGVRISGIQIFEVPILGDTIVQVGASTLQIRALGAQDEVELGAPRQLGQLIARSVKMRAVATTLERLAQSDIAILLEGETGTGKEVAAHAIHLASPRRDGPFVVFDCGAQSSGLLSSERFGHVNGAFTGAIADHPGALQAAEGGTIFLDEIGELPMDLQPLLLRALESKVSRQIGSTKVSSHNIRVVAATNRNLREEVYCGRFREDLLYRLAAATIQLPPLRERREDIAPLAQLFASEHDANLTPELLSLFMAHDWPGNIRELRHMVNRAAISSDPDFVAPQIKRTPVSLPEARRLANDDFERDYVEQVLLSAGNNVTRAAAIAGVSRQMLTRLIAKHNVARDV